MCHEPEDGIGRPTTRFEIHAPSSQNREAEYAAAGKPTSTQSEERRAQQEHHTTVHA